MSKRTNFLSFNNLDISELMGGTVVSIAKANSKMAKEQLKLLMESCFDEVGEVGEVGEYLYSPKMIKLNIYKGYIPPAETSPSDRKANLELNQIKATFQVPIISILPINSLAVKSSKVKMILEINEQRQITEKKSKGFKAFANSTIQLKGKVGKRANNLSLNNTIGRSAFIEIDMDVENFPLTNGLTNVLDLYSKSMDPLDVHVDDSSK